jgi:hypothetical protein
MNGRVLPMNGNLFGTGSRGKRGQGIFVPHHGLGRSWSCFIPHRQLPFQSNWSIVGFNDDSEREKPATLSLLVNSLVIGNRVRATSQ